MKPVGECLSRDAQRVSSQCQSGGGIVEDRPPLGGVESVPIEPSLDEPAWMGQRRLEIRQCGSRRGTLERLVGTWRQRQMVALATGSAQNRIDQTRRASFPDLARERNGIVHGGRCGNAIEMH